jgi:hypothetical protein
MGQTRGEKEGLVGYFDLGSVSSCELPRLNLSKTGISY